MDRKTELRKRAAARARARRSKPVFGTAMGSCGPNGVVPVNLAGHEYPLAGGPTGTFTVTSSSGMGWPSNPA
jgi:hypothetical protein